MFMLERAWKRAYKFTFTYVDLLIYFTNPLQTIFFSHIIKILNRYFQGRPDGAHGVA